jgi:hypothetical protein
MSEEPSPLKSLARPCVFTRLANNSIDKIRHQLELSSPVKTPCSPIKTTRSYVELDLLLKHEVSKIKKAIFKEKILSDEVAEMSPTPKINNFSRLLALKVVQNEHDKIMKFATPKCYINLKRDIDIAKARPETVEDRLRKRGLSPFVTKVAFQEGCDLSTMTKAMLLKKIKFGLIKDIKKTVS